MSEGGSMWCNRESDLSPMVCQWLRVRRFRCYGEVPFFDRSIDHVGLNQAGFTIGVEMKRRYTWKAANQAAIAQLACDLAFVAVANYPSVSSLQACEKCGIGVLVVQPCGARIVQRSRRFGGVQFTEQRDRFREFLRGYPENGPGGVTSKNRREATT